MTETKKGLRIMYPNGKETTYIIFRKHSFTPYDFCISYNNYYEVALHSSYMRVDKETLQVTTNGKDVDIFEKREDIKVEIVKL